VSQWREGGRRRRRAARRRARRGDSPPSILSALPLHRATLENIFIPNCAPGVYRGTSEVEERGHLLRRLVDRLNPAHVDLVPLSSQEKDVYDTCNPALVEEAEAVKRELAALLRLKRDKARRAAAGEGESTEQ